MNKLFNKLFIFDCAQNHQGSVEHGLRIIKEIAAVCENFKDCGFQFAFKLQYRDLDTFIHPDYKDSDLKYVKRFRETRLTEAEYLQLKEAIVAAGFISACTPFDEPSVDLVEKHGFDIVKIGSCSFTDWPLLERIVQTDKPIIASTAGASLENIDRVVSFFEHRNKDFALMHCVAEYPTKPEHLELNKIDILKNRYPNIPIGFSSHNKHSGIAIASIMKGACIYECHVGIGDRNDYSLNREEVFDVLNDAKGTYISCELIKNPTPKVQQALRGLQRGVWAKHDIQAGQDITLDNIYYAIPLLHENHIRANDITKYTKYVAGKDFKAGEPITFGDVIIHNKREQVLEIVKKLIPIIKESGVVLPDRCELELSSHYGLEKFEEYGAAILTIINREYAKKILIMLPKQKHPAHRHEKKEETFTVLHGELYIGHGAINPEIILAKQSVSCLIERNDVHIFETQTGCIFEEISTTHHADDSFYIDPNVLKDRKTKITFRKEWLTEGVK